MSELDKIRKLLQQNKSVLRREFKMKEMGIFGSYVQGKHKKNSDVDILVTFSETPGLFDYVRMENRLSAMLHKKVDLVMKESLKPNIGRNILREVVYV